MQNENSYKPEISFSFINYGDDKYKPIVEKIVKGTVGNAFFPNSQDKARVVEERYNAYAPTVVGPDKRNSETAAAREAARGPLDAALRDLLPAIQAESGGSLAKLLTTNIPLVRNKTVQQMPATPNAIELYLYGNPLQFYAKCETQTNAKVYEAQVSRDKLTWPWQAYDSKSAVGFSNLPAGETLYVQMRVKNSVGTSEWSTPKPFTIPVEGVAIPERKRPKGVK